MCILDFIGRVFEWGTNLQISQLGLYTSFARYNPRQLKVLQSGLVTMLQILFYV